MPYLDFQVNQVLTAAQVNTFLMNQAVMRFADSAARSSALGTAVAEGMVSYLDDTNAVEVYNGTSWGGLVSDPAISSSTATAYTIATADAGTYLQFSAAATVTVGTATDFTAGQQTTILADGTALTITTNGATLAGAGTAGTAVSFTVGAQYEAVSIFCVGTDNYRVIGNITAVE